MAKITLQWDHAGMADLYNIYKSTATMDPAAMPAPIGNTQVKLFNDTAVTAGLGYYYIVGAVFGGIEKLSQEHFIQTEGGDIYFTNVDFLLFGDGVSYPSTNFIDKSTRNRTILKTSPDVVIVDSNVTQPKYDNGSIYLNGASTRLYSLLGQIGTQDFTFEFWIKPINNPASPTEFLRFSASSDGSVPVYNSGIYLLYGASKVGLAMAVSGLGQVYVIEPAGNIQSGFWNHICVIRKTSKFYLFINGVLIGTTTSWADQVLNANYLHIGYGLASYYNSIRMTLGVSRYSTSGFMPPDKKFKDY